MNSDRQRQAVAEANRRRFAAQNLVGQTVNGKAVLSVGYYPGTRKRWYTYRCSCGHVSRACAAQLKAHKGCNACSDTGRDFEPVHGGHESPTWKSWRAMIDRCTRPGHKSWHRYGGRGIRICDRWRASFTDFLADMGERPEGMTLDRYPDPDGNYEPGNCRWATPAQQRANYGSK